MKKFWTIAAAALLFFRQTEAYELGIATIFKDCAPYFKEWIEYHKMVGVDHFWLYNNSSTDNWEEVLKPYVEQGLVEVFYAPNKKGFTWFVAQRESISDGIRRAQETKTKWIALIDQDEFLLPMDGSKTIPECLEKNFSPFSAVYVNWKNFGTGGIFLKDGGSQIFNLTSCGPVDHPRNSTGKSIVRPEWVDASKVNYVHHFNLKEGGVYANGDKEIIQRIDGHLKTSGKHYNCLRINHYQFRDEKYLREVRIPRDISIGLKRTEQDYEIFNKEKDFAIINFIKEKHPKSFKKSAQIFGN